MELSLLCHHGSLKTLLPACQKPGRGSSRMGRGGRFVAVMANPKDGTAGVTRTTAMAAEKKVYDDNWFDRLAIHHLSRSIQATTGVRTEKEGYESLIEAASVVSRRYGAEGQQELVIKALDTAFPSAILATIRALLPQSKFAREFFATFTTWFFAWLIGRCEVRESEFQGRREKNVVYIRKCRFLESTNCVGMCTNLCKLPTEKFIQDSFGMPIHMVPNFEDLSCEMIFGQHPPADDPALKQPCYQSLCIAKRTHEVSCSS